MLKLFGGGGGGNGEGKTWHGKSIRIEHYHVTVEDVLAEGTMYIICISMYTLARRITLSLCLSVSAVYTKVVLKVLVFFTTLLCVPVCMVFVR